MSEKEKIAVTLLCIHCLNTAPMERVAQYEQSENFSNDSFGAWSVGIIYELFVCPSCQKVTLRSCNFHELRDPEDWIVNTLYPTQDKIPIGLPQHIKESFELAIRVKNISPNAYGVLLGRTLELVCIDKNAKGKSLHNQLEDLQKRGEIPDSVVEISHNLRNLRNVGAHPSLGNLTDEEVPILSDLCRVVLEYLYSAPALINDAKTKYSEIQKRKGI